MLHVTDIVVRYGRMTALRGVSLHVDAGEVVCIIGPNGAGKSTTLAAIAGGVALQSGSIHLDGRAIGGLSPERISRLGFSFVPEGRLVFGTLSVAENLRVGSYQRSDKRNVEVDYRRILEMFPRLAERRNEPATRLSGGEQQMLVIGRALMTRPRLIAIDEPSLGLAPKIVDQVYDVLLDLRLRDGVTLLINEQSAERVLRVADRAYVLRNGQVQLHSRVTDLDEGEAIRQAYFGFAGEPEVETSDAS